MGRVITAFSAVLVVMSAAVPAQPALAQGLFEVLFGGFNHRRAPMPHRMTAYSDPFGFDDRRDRRYSDQHGGPSSGYCVRTCDGRYFPVRSSGAMSATELCKSFCPAAKTKVFSGGKIDHSIASDGTRYADLDNAFLYRERLVPNCTCNGKDAFGLAPLNTETDPTLRPGDIVATNQGLATFNGNRRSNAGEFTPIAQSGGSSEWRDRLMSIKVTPAAPRAEMPAPPVEEDKSAQRNDRRRVQR